jgi:hypothetical protein
MTNSPKICLISLFFTSGAANFYVPRCPSFSHCYIDDFFARRPHNFLTARAIANSNCKVLMGAP